MVLSNLNRIHVREEPKHIPSNTLKFGQFARIVEPADALVSTLYNGEVVQKRSDWSLQVLSNGACLTHEYVVEPLPEGTEITITVGGGKA